MRMIDFPTPVDTNVCLANYTSYKIGGPARYFAEVDSVDTLAILLKFVKENNIPWFILGGGSNLLISDDGFNGLVIKLSSHDCSPEFDYENHTCSVFAGISMARLLNLYKRNKACGLEFFAGIPGSLGGAIKMNAGRKDAWISSRIKWIKLIDDCGNINTYSHDEIEWDYRHSSIKDNQIVVEAQLLFDDVLNDEQQNEIDAQISEYNSKRRAAQPLNYPSCGSVFKNPKGDFSARLIEECGLKGYAVGGAMISDKHANFIINKDNARAQDVVSIIQHVQKTVFDNNGIMLNPEVKFVGFDKPVSLF